RPDQELRQAVLAREPRRAERERLHHGALQRRRYRAGGDAVGVQEALMLVATSPWRGEVGARSAPAGGDLLRFGYLLLTPPPSPPLRASERPSPPRRRYAGLPRWRPVPAPAWPA